MAKAKASPAMSDEAVQAKTGKKWDEWYTILDKAGAKSMPHTEIAALLSGKHKLPGWWSQMVTVGYERARGLRDVHETTEGFHAGVSRTMAVSLSTLFAAWNDAKSRTKWLGTDYTVRRVTPEKSIRLVSNTDQNPIDVTFFAKGDGKSLVVVDQTKLKSEDDVMRMKAHWSKVLNTLKTKLGG